ncbi:hypothetical protein Zm00014a_032724 [Zea mays]|uniref:FLZ-type domain-containing protein n=1 Tax=Zea mays TaxID=4577 RepID=A0A317YAL9_MAIZE|nr:hypothetical protein Zm00014a_032724 [Zea mays]
MAVVEACDPARIDISSKTAAPSEWTTQLISGGRHAATPPLPSSCSPPTPASHSSSTVSPSPPSLHLASRARTKYSLIDQTVACTISNLIPKSCLIDRCPKCAELKLSRENVAFCEKLKEGEDIYIYQGDKSFCSTECRENFMVDEMEDDHRVLVYEFIL